MAKLRLKLVDLCKINTDAFRKMTPKQLAKAKAAIGPYGAFTKVDTHRGDGYGVPKKLARKAAANNVLLYKYANALWSAQTIKPLNEQSAKAYRETYKEEPPDDNKIIASYKRDADRLEKAIWDLQVRNGCQIKPDELVARDAERVGDKRAVARIRKKPLIR